ncbi:hypothetical protein F4860DRAFT_341452 [Xylaria cubensis]|nr:hypothetical protein F4860DRAFT_341452 [Xylaria cubensis]
MFGNLRYTNCLQTKTKIIMTSDSIDQQKSVICKRSWCKEPGDKKGYCQYHIESYEKELAQKRDRRRKFREQGLCNCGRKATQGRSCSICKDKHRDRCVRCSKPLEDKTRLTCLSCRTKARQRSMNLAKQGRCTCCGRDVDPTPRPLKRCARCRNTEKAARLAKQLLNSQVKSPARAESKPASIDNEGSLRAGGGILPGET